MSQIYNIQGTITSIYGNRRLQYFSTFGDKSFCNKNIFAQRLDEILQRIYLDFYIYTNAYSKVFCYLIYYHLFKNKNLKIIFFFWNVFLRLICNGYSVKIGSDDRSKVRRLDVQKNKVMGLYCFVVWLKKIVKDMSYF